MKRYEKIHLIHVMTGLPIQQLVQMEREEIEMLFWTVSSYVDGEETA
jgi:hypothetical protein